eukprot:TRINITY_DN5765_c0_g3_i1.p1 TRINITY_DN5765_c0_g3~~TRINITY_DN5765_c0_g3_i1.p1  ORF type:complete len:409 (+),score=109.71 TRINITY_DN5765_c0_g3_i1:82-1308(+)
MPPTPTSLAAMAAALHATEALERAHWGEEEGQAWAAVMKLRGAAERGARHVDPTGDLGAAHALPGMERRFGVELEFVFAASGRTPGAGALWLLVDPFTQGVKRLKKAMDAHPYTVAHRIDKQTEAYDRWLITEDASVVNFGRRAAGLEVVSPILEGEQGMRDLLARMAVLQTVDGAGGDHCAGLHVHLNLADFTNDDVKYLIALWVFYEAFFDSLVPPERREDRCAAARSLVVSCLGSYGAAASPGDLFRRLTAIDVGASLEPLLAVATPALNAKNVNSRRYHKVNPTHAALHGVGNPSRRLEFRSHPSTLCAEDMQHWCVLLDRFAAAAKGLAARQPVDPATLPPCCFDLIGVPQLTAFYTAKRRSLPTTTPATYTWRTRESVAFQAGHTARASLYSSSPPRKAPPA